eukprot:709649-Amorphochlora_amoeboformis.AAC.1
MGSQKVRKREILRPPVPHQNDPEERKKLRREQKAKVCVQIINKTCSVSLDNPQHQRIVNKLSLLCGARKLQQSVKSESCKEYSASLTSLTRNVRKVPTMSPELREHAMEKLAWLRKQTQKSADNIVSLSPDSYKEYVNDGN